MGKGLLGKAYGKAKNIIKQEYKDRRELKQAERSALKMARLEETKNFAKQKAKLETKRKLDAAKRPAGSFLTGVVQPSRAPQTRTTPSRNKKKGNKKKGNKKKGNKKRNTPRYEQPRSPPSFPDFRF